MPTNEVEKLKQSAADVTAHVEKTTEQLFVDMMKLFHCSREEAARRIAREIVRKVINNGSSNDRFP